MCMRFACNLKINFCPFLQFELSHYLAQLLPMHIDTVYLVNAIPYTI